MGFPMAQTVKNIPALQETWVWPLGWKDPLEEGMATHFSILARRIPMDRGAWWLHSPCGHRVRHDWTTKHSTAQGINSHWNINCYRTELLFNNKKKIKYILSESNYLLLIVTVLWTTSGLLKTESSHWDFSLNCSVNGLESILWTNKVCLAYSSYEFISMTFCFS